MGHYVHLSVIFACDDYGDVAPLAAKHLAALPEEASSEQLGRGEFEDLREARRFLHDLSERSGRQHCGHKGGLATWGIVGNYTTGKGFVETLRPFWTDLLHGEGAPFDFEHIMVFVEAEQRERADAYEIFLEVIPDPNAPDGARLGPVVIKHHPDLPFAWMQM
jgi:hypothetical protein